MSDETKAEDPLPPFSGSATTCPKCGYVGASTEFLPAGTRCVHAERHSTVRFERGAPDRLRVGRGDRRLLHRVCRRCDSVTGEQENDT